MEWEWLTDTLGVYRDAEHPLTEDPLCLMRFCSCREQDRVLDLGCGTGVLSVLAAARGASVCGIDIDPHAVEFATRAATVNGQSIRFLTADVTDAPKLLGHGAFTHILMNPPYFDEGDCGRSTLFCHGTAATLPDWCRAAFLLLNNGGKLSVCYPADRLAVLFRALDQARLSPKRMELKLHGDRARLVLVEARKLGGDGLEIRI